MSRIKKYWEKSQNDLEINVCGGKDTWRNMLLDNYLKEKNVRRNISGRYFLGRKLWVTHEKYILFQNNSKKWYFFCFCIKNYTDQLDSTTIFSKLAKKSKMTFSEGLNWKVTKYEHAAFNELEMVDDKGIGLMLQGAHEL